MNCPKCGNKIPRGFDTCLYCDTKVAQFTNGSNRAAKQAIKEGRKDEVVMTTTIPSDVSKTRLLIYSIALGFAGAHCFYVGRKARGWIIPILFITCFLFIIIPESWFLHAYLSGITAGMIGAVGVFMWWWDILRIMFGKYNIPILLTSRRRPDVLTVQGVEIKKDLFDEILETSQKRKPKPNQAESNIAVDAKVADSTANKTAVENAAASPVADGDDRPAQVQEELSAKAPANTERSQKYGQYKNTKNKKKK